MTLEQHNAHTMYAKNNTGAFIKLVLIHKYIRKRAREEDSSELP
jgi:hypothetical protein